MAGLGGSRPPARQASRSRVSIRREVALEQLDLRFEVGGRSVDHLGIETGSQGVGDPVVGEDGKPAPGKQLARPRGQNRPGQTQPIQ